MAFGAANIDDLRELARRRLPRFLFDYIDGAAMDETTARRNITAFDDWCLGQRVMRDISRRDLTTRFLGARHALPLILAPVGVCGLYSGHGEVAIARAAGAAGVPMCLSTFSIASIEEVTAEASGPVYMQLYLLRDRGLALELLRRIAAAGVDTLFLTVDATLGGIRYRDVRSGMSRPGGIGPRLWWDMARHPRWLVDQARCGPPRLGHVDGGGKDLMAQLGFLASQFDPTLNWSDIGWLRQHWSGRLVIKGIMSADDAQAALDQGADALVVSNHGGRQLDGAQAAIRALPHIADRLGGRAELLFDSGVRNGTHVVKALALGATAVLVGRAYIWGLAAGGERGVSTAIEMLAAEAGNVMGLMGVGNWDELRAHAAELVHAAH